jgi:hypothetical protein
MPKLHYAQHRSTVGWDEAERNPSFRRVSAMLQPSLRNWSLPPIG